MSMELDFWIPNLSGEVATLSRLERHIVDRENEDYAVTYADGKVFISMSEDMSDVNPDFMLTVEIKDCSGRCHLTCNRDADLMPILKANRAWNIFRKMLDGCEGTVYDCSAIREPFNVFHKRLMKKRLHRISGNYYVDMANRFIQSVEDVSDTMNHIWSEGP